MWTTDKDKVIEVALEIDSEMAHAGAPAYPEAFGLAELVEFAKKSIPDWAEALKSAESFQISVRFIDRREKDNADAQRPAVQAG